MRIWRLIRCFWAASAQGELAYRANFWISLLNAGLNLGTGALGLVVLFGQVPTIQGWTLDSTLALLGVYLTMGALRGLVIGPSLEALAGMDGEVWTGRFDFTLLRPLDVQFQASLGRWRPLALIDLALGLVVLGIALVRMGQALELVHLAMFVVALFAGVVILYALLLALAGLVFWSPGFLFTWILDGLFQLARYPLRIYPRWVQLVLSWIVPVGVITAVPVEALNGALSPAGLAGAVGLAALLFVVASAVFRGGLRRYASASS